MSELLEACYSAEIVEREWVIGDGQMDSQSSGWWASFALWMRLKVNGRWLKKFLIPMTVIFLAL